MLSLKATKHHGESGTLIPSSSIQCSVSIPGFVKNLELNNEMLSLRWMFELLKTILWFNLTQIKGQNHKCKFSALLSHAGKKYINMNKDWELSAQGTCGKWWLAFFLQASVNYFCIVIDCTADAVVRRKWQKYNWAGQFLMNSIYILSD